MLIIVMVGAAAAVMVSTQQDLSVSGQDREQLQAFYAAEFAIAQAKDYLATNPAVLNFTDWSPIFTPGANPFVCTRTPLDTTGHPLLPPRDAGAWVDFQNPAFFVSGGAAGAAKAQYRFCFHNDPEDFNYGNANAGNGDLADDGSHLLTIEGYGQVIPSAGTNPLAMATAQVWVVIAKPTGQPTALSNCYSQEGGCGGHSANGGAQDKGISVITAGSTTPVRGL
jgi:hypothetical protein